MGRRRTAIKTRGKTGLLFRLAVFLLAAAIGIVLLDMQMRPELCRLAQNKAQQLAGQLAAQAVSDAIAGEEEQPSLVEVQRQEDGTVTAIQTNGAAAAQLKSRVEQSLFAVFSSPQQPGFSIPLGALTGLSLFSGTGPDLSFSLFQVGTPLVEWESALESAGINQTVHRVYLSVTLKVDALFAGITVSAESRTRYLVAETVVVGEVPQFFAGITGKEVG